MTGLRDRTFFTKFRGRALADLTFLSMRVAPRVKINGRSYTLRTSQRNGLLRAASQQRGYERGHDRVLAVLLQERPGAFLDVGANVGQTLLKVITIDPARQYVGFEPQLSAALCIDQFIKDNQLGDHSIFPIGLSDRDTVLMFGSRFEGDTTASASLDIRPTSFYQYVTRVVSRSGDSVVDDMGIREVSVLKIDVEGAELSVLNGFNRTIERCRPAVVFECLPRILRVTGERLPDDILARRDRSYGDIDEFFKKADYELYLLSDDGTLTEAEQVVSDDRNIRNYVAIPAGSTPPGS